MNTPTIKINGKEFVTKTGTRFMVRGVAVSASKTVPTNLDIDDILANENNTYFEATILPKLKAANVNLIRVYQVDPKHHHNLTMAKLESEGIYVMVGLATSNNSVKQETGAYSQGTFLHAAQVVDEFQAYDNTMCFSVGNEVEFPGTQANYIKKLNPTLDDDKIVKATRNLQYNVAQAIKSFARDIKHHISTKSYRSIPVGCAMQDAPQSSWGNINKVRKNKPQPWVCGIIGTDTIAQYYAAGPDAMDFIGINSYRYVTGNPWKTAYLGLANEASLLPVPVFLTETGAVTGSNRDWKGIKSNYKVEAIGEQISGEIAFQLLDEGAKIGTDDVSYGIYKVESGNTLKATAMGGHADLAAEFLAASSETPAAISTTPTSITAPTSVTMPASPPMTKPVYKALTIQLDFPTDLLPVKKTLSNLNTTIKIANFAPVPIQVLQDGLVVGAAASGVQTNPTIITIKVSNASDVQIQGYISATTSWDNACSIKSSAIVAGKTYGNNINWHGNPACPIITATYGSITVTNHKSYEINLAQNDTSIGTIPAVGKSGPVTKTIEIMEGVELILQHIAPSYTVVCTVAADKVTAGITVSNDVNSGSTTACLL
ncbi:MAG: hypothetical protein HRT71_02655 [Flavobacteriales bacterium]|nr:hypothetical protein [Flavobacteriales bacterium]